MRVEVGQDRRELHPTLGYERPGDFLQDVATAEMTGQVPEQLRPLQIQAAAGADEMGHYDVSHGFCAPSSGSPFVLSAAAEDDPAAGRTLPVPMTTPIVRVRARCDKDHRTSISGGLVVARHPETVALDPSRGEFEQVVLTANDGFGFALASNNIVTDSFPSFAATLGEAFRDEFGGLFLEERIRGTGVGEFTGLLNSPGLITIDGEVGQGKTIIPDNVVKMRARCWGYPRAVWLAIHDALPHILKLVLVVGAAGSVIPLWRPGVDGWPDTLAGRPLFACERCSALGDVGDLILVNWSQYLDGTYQPFRGVDSIHVRYLQHETAFKFWVRNDGAPWWRSPVTPKYSANTLSPYVTLAARA